MIHANTVPSPKQQQNGYNFRQEQLGRSKEMEDLSGMPSSRPYPPFHNIFPAERTRYRPSPDKALLISHSANPIQPLINFPFIKPRLSALVRHFLQRPRHDRILAFQRGEKHAAVIRIDGNADLSASAEFFCGMYQSLIIQSGHRMSAVFPERTDFGIRSGIALNRQAPPGNIKLHPALYRFYGCNIILTYGNIYNFRPCIFYSLAILIKIIYFRRRKCLK